MSLDEALAFHGLTKETMSAELISWIERVRLESPDLYRIIITDPPHMKRMMGIKRWDFVFSTGMTTDYPVRRGWNDFMGVRELIQNALDIEDRLFGYDGIAIRVGVIEELGLEVSDRGPGIKYDAFKLGGSDKGCHERGYFGEGLKVALAYFAYIGRPVYIFTRSGQVFKPVIAPGGLVLIAMGRATPVTGTTSIVYGHFPRIEVVRRIIFQECIKDPDLKIIARVNRRGDACEVERPHFIVAYRNPEMFVNYLWVRDISVNNIRALTGTPSVFGYNLWWVTLEPNRVAVSSIPELRKEVAKTFTPEALRELLNRVVTIEDGIHKLPPDFFETEMVDWGYSTAEVKNEAAKWVAEKGLGWTDNERAVDWALYMGAKPLLVPWNMKFLFSGAPTLEKMVIVKGVKRVVEAEAGAVPREALNINELSNLTAAEIVMTDIHMDLAGTEIMAPKIVVSERMDVSGLETKNKIYLNRIDLADREATLENALHEYAHHYAKRRFREARDLTEEFEKALTLVAAAAVRLDERARQALTRAFYLAWGAKAHQWIGKYDYLPYLHERFRMKLEETLKQLYNLTQLGTWLHDDLERTFNTSPPIYFALKLSIEDEIGIRGGLFGVERRHIEFGHGLYLIRDLAIPLPRVDIYKAAISRFLDEMEDSLRSRWIHVAIIFLYNPEEDNYEVWKVIRP
ncbi:MAG: hypothetical protein QXH00_11140 [Candidatus Jordarchaeales archaeon]